MVVVHDPTMAPEDHIIVEVAFFTFAQIYDDDGVFLE
jgi:hypothetical protein